MSESRNRGEHKLKAIRNNPYRVRLNDEENERLVNLSKKTGMNISDILRSGIGALEREVEREK